MPLNAEENPVPFSANGPRLTFNGCFPLGYLLYNCTLIYAVDIYLVGFQKKKKKNYEKDYQQEKVEVSLHWEQKLMLFPNWFGGKFSGGWLGGCSTMNGI